MYLYCLLFGMIVHFGGVMSIKRYFVSDSCGHVYGPDQLTILEFDKDVDYDHSKPSTDQDLLPPVKLRNRVWECIVIVRGMPSTTTNKSIGLQWRDFHMWDPNTNTLGNSVQDCGKAYVTVYKGSDTNARKSWTMCGKDTTQKFFEWVGEYMTFKFYADFRRDPAWVPPATLTPPKTPATTSRTDCIHPSNVSDNSTTPLPLCVTENPMDGTTTPPDLYPYPEMYFRADVTSFDYSCKSTIPNEVWKCEDSQRCLDDSLKCDVYYSQNCKSSGFPGDKSDQSRSAPSFCYGKRTTTLPPSTTEEVPPADIPWATVAASVMAAVAFLALLWCCWRPGYLPWRLARFRNAACCHTSTCTCCRRGHDAFWACCVTRDMADGDLIGMVGSRVKKRGSLIGHGLRHKNLAKVGPVRYGHVVSPSLTSGLYQYSTNRRALNTTLPASVYGKDPDNFASDWLKLISGDGAYLREQR